MGAWQSTAPYKAMVKRSPQNHCAGAVGDPRSLAAMVRFYRAECSPAVKGELDSFRTEPTLRSALKRAAFAQTPDGKRYRHQARLPAEALERAYRSLARASFRDVRSFDALHSLVARKIGPIPRLGELMIYDTALRIGAKLDLEPEFVYLHRGTRDGARALGLQSSEGRLRVSELPIALRRLSPHEIEDFLCRFKNSLLKFRRSSSRTR